MDTSTGATRDSVVPRSLLWCGVIAAAVYMLGDVLAAVMYPGYSYVDRQQSELSAIGAPTRAFWIGMVSVYTPLMIAFAAGVWRSGVSKKALRAVGGLLVAFAVVGYLWVLFAPMHPVGEAEARSLTDTMHLVFLVIQILVMVLFMSFGAAALGGSFRRFSMLTIVAMLVAGGIVGTQAQAIAAGHSPPWLGLVERVSIYAPMLWISALALTVLGGVRAAPDGSAAMR